MPEKDMFDILAGGKPKEIFLIDQETGSKVHIGDARSIELKPNRIDTPLQDLIGREMSMQFTVEGPSAEALRELMEATEQNYRDFHTQVMACTYQIVKHILKVESNRDISIDECMAAGIDAFVYAYDADGEFFFAGMRHKTDLVSLNFKRYDFKEFARSYRTVLIFLKDKKAK